MTRFTRTTVTPEERFGALRRSASRSTRKLLGGLFLAALLAIPAAAQGGPSDARRIVSIGGSLTEIIYALGAADRVVAVDTTSLYPPEALATKPNVGYMRALSAEGVLAVDPDLVLVLDGSGPPEALDVLGKAAVPVLKVPDEPSIAGIGAKIRAVAAILGKEAEGEALAARVDADIAAVEAVVATVPVRRKIIFVLSFANGRIMAAGAGTAADAIIRLAGAENALSGFDGYKPVSDEAVMAAAPDAVVTMRNGGDTVRTAEEVFAFPALAATPAAETKALIAIDGLTLLGFGPRTAVGIRELAAALYPDLNLPDFSD